VENPARQALLRFMGELSESIWCAGWFMSLETALLRSQLDLADLAAYEWLVTEAGGWWTWLGEVDSPEFVEGTLTELKGLARVV